MAELRDHFHLFVYGTLRSGERSNGLLRGCELTAEAEVNGVLYDIDGEFPALVLYGSAPVRGEVWRCPASLLRELDAHEGLERGLFRRVGVSVANPASERDPFACWTYVAGPALARLLVPARQITHWPGPASSDV